MAFWLLKTEPSTYSWADLAREGTTAWTGVSNAQAQRNLKAMHRGDRVIVYHSGEKRAVGVAEVVRTAYPDPEADGALVCVNVRAVEARPAPVPLEQPKLEPAFHKSVLVRQGRLSVVPLAPAEWHDLLEVAQVIGRTGGMSAAPQF